MSFLCLALLVQQPTKEATRWLASEPDYFVFLALVCSTVIWQTDECFADS